MWRGGDGRRGSGGGAVESRVASLVAAAGQLVLRRSHWFDPRHSAAVVARTASLGFTDDRLLQSLTRRMLARQGQVSTAPRDLREDLCVKAVQPAIKLRVGPLLFSLLPPAPQHSRVDIALRIAALENDCPAKGSLVIQPNASQGCPVVRGVKWTATSWVHTMAYDMEGYLHPVTSERDGEPGACVDLNDQCGHWAGLGECKRNPAYMNAHYARACDACEPCSGPNDLPCINRNRQALGFMVYDQEELDA
ncbi:hypothetical protein GPECTOR_37g230 [Gonium pectorale]|uniref:ShKT domain-containing protein n=1 Tax=Gonium pectorale TaxID=33097 RepID=A0A150GBL1_GONPE|nr:hypothetical protein GPECTOR_37g230 [Gonium pectorale]|eukprot:KXZ47224.1 hypothetical protein GPECTOR_37g230 [Gonium pectorale]